MLIKTSAVCVLMLLYMIGFYYRKPHIPIRSTRIFQMITLVALLSTVFDLVTIYTVNHRDTVPEMVNLAAHIIYLLSILGFVFLLFLYLRSFLETNRKFPRAVKICQWLPFIFSTIGILTLPITYIHGETTDYSLGPKAYALYASLVIYLLLILYYCLRYWEILDGDKRAAIILAVPIYAVVAVVQMLLPETLIVIVAATLIMLGLILSNENTEKYMDEKTSLFNQYSLETILEEIFSRKQKVEMAVLCFSKKENNIDWKQDVSILQDIHGELKLSRQQGYRICENGVVFIAGSEGKTRAILDETKNAVEKKYGSDNITIETKILSEEETVTKHDCMRNIIAFCTEIGSRFAYIDYLTHIYNRNAFERDVAALDESSGGCYLIADLNDLKIVNDTIGHSAGDELLQNFAALLVEVSNGMGRVYRQGGDEFAVLYEGDAQQFICRLEECCRVHNSSSSVPIRYAIGACELCDSDFMGVADQRMYADKREKKQNKSQIL